jgi:hypothetical protein
MVVKPIGVEPHGVLEPVAREVVAFSTELEVPLLSAAFQDLASLPILGATSLALLDNVISDEPQ